MANPDHLEIILQGPAEWNNWRRENRDAKVDLSEANLNSANLRGANLSWANLRRANLSAADLGGAILGGAVLDNASLRGANLAEADLSGASFRGTDFGDADLSKATLLLATLTGDDLSGANLGGANLGGANLREANLMAANLSGADLVGARLGFANVRLGDLSRASLADANLSWADFSGANFMGANLSGTNISEADLSEANLSEADLRSARLQNAKLAGAVLTAAKLWESQRAGWSIKGIVCESASWDKGGEELTKYTPGEFERLHAEQPRIELLYAGGITKFELDTLPALLHHLSNLHPTCEIRLKAVEDSAGGAKVTIAIADADQAAFENIKTLAHQLQSVQVALRDEAKRTERLEIEKRLLLDQVFPRLLAIASPQVHIAGSATGVVVATGNASVKAYQNINDIAAIEGILAQIEKRYSELSLAAGDDNRLIGAVHNVQEELRKSQPRHPAVAEGLKTVRDFVIAAISGAAGTALATNQWQPLADQLAHFLRLFGG